MEDQGYTVLPKRNPDVECNQPIKDYNLFKKIKDFHFSMPAGWLDEDIGIFIALCWENVEELREFTKDDIKKWTKIAESGSQLSTKPTLWNVNSCMEIAQSIRAYVLRNRAKVEFKFKVFFDDVKRLLKYFPAENESVHLSRLKQKPQVTDEIDYSKFPDSVCSMRFNIDSILLPIIKEHIHFFKPKCYQSKVWDIMSKKLSDIVGLCGINFKDHLRDMKLCLINETKNETDPQRKKEVFLTRAKHYIPLFDYIPPTKYKKSQFLNVQRNTKQNSSHARKRKVEIESDSDYQEERRILPSRAARYKKQKPCSNITRSLPPREAKNKMRFVLDNMKEEDEIPLSERITAKKLLSVGVQHDRVPEADTKKKYEEQSSNENVDTIKRNVEIREMNESPDFLGFDSDESREENDSVRMKDKGTNCKSLGVYRHEASNTNAASNEESMSIWKNTFEYGNVPSTSSSLNGSPDRYAHFQNENEVILPSESIKDAAIRLTDNQTNGDDQQRISPKNVDLFDLGPEALTRLRETIQEPENVCELPFFKTCHELLTRTYALNVEREEPAKEDNQYPDWFGGFLQEYKKDDIWSLYELIKTQQCIAYIARKRVSSLETLADKLMTERSLKNLT